MGRPHPGKVVRYRKTTNPVLLIRGESQGDIKSFKSEKLVHGRTGVTAEESRWIGFLRESIGNLERLPAIVKHWRRTGERLN
jgi:hypothetical protein